MLTFAIKAPQTVAVGEQSLTFDVDPADTSLVTLVMGDYTVVFKRNGDLVSCTKAEPEKPVAKPIVEKPIDTGDFYGGQQSEGHRPAGWTGEPFPVSGGAQT